MALLLTPTIRAPEKRAISINGPPTPQPMSAATMPGPSPSRCAM